MYLKWIGLRPGRRESLIPVEEAEVNTEEGLVGDHYQKADGKRQVTLIHANALSFIGNAIASEPVDPGLTRRNLVVTGKEVDFLDGEYLKIGDEVVLEVTGPCRPCSRMEENLGKKGFLAMSGKGGWTARVVQGGTIFLGDEILPHKP